MALARINIEPKTRELASEIMHKHSLGSINESLEFIIKAGTELLQESNTTENESKLGRKRKKREFIVIKI